MRTYLLKAGLILAVIPALCSGVRAGSQTQTGHALNLFRAIPVIEFSAYSKMLSRESLCVEGHPKRDRACYETARVIGRGEASSNDEIREADSQGQSYQGEGSNDKSQTGNDNAGNIRPRWFVFRNRYVDGVAVVFTYVFCFLFGFWLIQSAGNIKDITLVGIAKVATGMIVVLSGFAFVIHAAILLFEAL